MSASFPPRGWKADVNETAPESRWGDTAYLSRRWDHSDRKVLLGLANGREIGDPDSQHRPAGSGDDRHIVTIAGTRAGKSRSVLIPNLLRYRGSMVVIDPKGELVANTAAKRATLGDVFILDPFGITPEEFAPFRAQFNPFIELSQSRPQTRAADAAQIADALIIKGADKDSHWTDAGKNLLRGLILFLHDERPGEANIAGLRRCFNGSTPDLIRLFDEMAHSDAYGGVIANTGRAFKNKFERGEPSGELRSILSTVNEQTWPLDDIAHISTESSFFLSALTEQPITIYLVLPATRLETHARWLRLLINLTMAAIERNPVVGLYEGATPVWVVLEEFAALGTMKSIETAAGFMAGMGCKLWVILQDLTQLKTHYEHSWETFLGNAGVIQAWSNVDVTTTEYLSKLLGQTTILETRYDQTSSHGLAQGDVGERKQLRTIPLLDPAEVAFHFARETGRQLILSPGRPPLFINRLGVEDGA